MAAAVSVDSDIRPLTGLSARDSREVLGRQSGRLHHYLVQAAHRAAALVGYLRDAQRTSRAHRHAQSLGGEAARWANLSHARV
jgi:hypothetical protein